MVLELQQLTGRVWILPGDPDPDRVRPCVAVITGDEGSTVVDAGQSPEHAALVQRAMAGAGLAPARWLVYTHHHWDHTWGACAWPEDVEVIGHESGVEPLAAEGRKPWSHAYLAERMAAEPRLGPSYRARSRAMPTWEGFEVRLPARTFGDRLELPGGIEVRHVGGGHAVDSAVVAVRGGSGPDDGGVMLLGDCFYPPPAHLREPGDDIDLARVTALVAEGFEWYVDSHSPPWRRDSVTDLP